MNTQVKELVNSIKKVLQDYTKNQITTENLKVRLKEFISNYKMLETGLSRKSGTEILRGVCYYHNIENFTLLTGIYKVSKDEILPLAYYGDAGCHKIVSNLNPIILVSLPAGKAMTIPEGEIPGFAHTIHIKSMISGKDYSYFLAAVASSRFFSHQKFSHCADVFSNLLYEIVIESQTYTLDYSGTVRNEVESLASALLAKKNIVYARYFTFSLVGRIFNHLGPNSLLEIPDIIVDTFRKNIPGNPVIFPCSLWEYIILSLEKPEKLHSKSQKKIEFLYQGITLPYHTLYQIIDSRADLVAFWDHIAKLQYEYVNGETPI